MNQRLPRPARRERAQHGSGFHEVWSGAYDVKNIHGKKDRLSPIRLSLSYVEVCFVLDIVTVVF
jgi:hypothetical protein